MMGEVQVPAESGESQPKFTVESSWPGFVEVTTHLGDMRSRLGEETYHRQLELQRALWLESGGGARMLGRRGIAGVASEL